MSSLLQCHRVSHTIGTRVLFTELDLNINSGDRIGLVGHNGSGKTTLLSILDGRLQPDDGDIARSSQLILETVEQFIDPALHKTTLLTALIEKLPDEEKLVHQYKAEQLLAQLGFTESEFSFLVEDLSGGQQNRLMFARAMLNEPNLILFDEPTNHLDLASLLIFEDFLLASRAAFLIISHDREFLDDVTSRTIFLRDQRLYHFDLSYTDAKTALQAQDEAAATTREQEERNIRRLEASAKRIATWGKVFDNAKFSRKAKSMEKRIERMKDDKTFVSRGSGLNLTIDVNSAQANRMLHIEQQDIDAPDGSQLFHTDDMMIRPGERVALLGHNGAGKTTLINQVMHCYENNPDGEVIRFNPQCDIGYYDQEMQRLDSSLDLMAALRENCGGADAELKSALIRAGFPYRELDKPVSALSGGERARLMFLIIKLNQPNFLILDEPTNHIDIQGKEQLEQQILDSGATVLITSHDRRFVDNIAQRYLLISGGELYEIHDPQVFYRQSPGRRTEQAIDPTEAESLPDDEEAALARIVELEALLEADLARKPKFQKPVLQQKWREEIDALNKLL